MVRVLPVQLAVPGAGVRFISRVQVSVYVVAVLGDAALYCTSPRERTSSAVAWAAVEPGVTTTLSVLVNALIREPAGKPPPVTLLLTSVAANVAVVDVNVLVAPAV